MAFKRSITVLLLSLLSYGSLNALNVSCKLSPEVIFFNGSQTLDVQNPDTEQPKVFNVTFELRPNECLIRERIYLEENDTLTILKPAREIEIIRLTGYSTLPTFPDVIFYTFPKLLEAHLVFSGIEVIHDFNFEKAENLKLLRLEMNNIDFIPKLVFSKAKNLEVISLAANRINRIDNFAFKLLQKLRILSLEQNNLTELKEYTFAGAPNIRKLRLDNNQIQTIEDGALYLEHLEELFLQNNQLTTLSDEMFLNTMALASIDLSGNKLPSINSTFESCLNLKVLSLDDNEIRSVNWTSLAKLPVLTVVSLKNNSILFKKEHQPQRVLRSRLQYLNLANNRMYNTDILKQLSIFRRLQILDLNNNVFILFDDIKHVRSLFPHFKSLNVVGNSINCKWLEESKTFIESNKFLMDVGEQCKNA